ncbi:MAG: YCF48-related protein [Candidatus Kapaibacterium sp.]
MRNFLILCVIFLPVFARAEVNQWYKLNSDLLHVTSAGTSSCFAVGTDGVLMRSPNKGDSWRQIPTGYADSLMNIAFADSLHGVAVGENGSLLSTDDAGISWRIQTLGTRTLRAVAFRENVGIIVGDQGTIFRTEDGGKKWMRVNTSRTEAFFSVAFLSNGIVLIGAENGLVFRSTDSGITWDDTKAEPVFNSLYRIRAITVSAEKTVYAVAARETFSFLLKSEDNGSTWNPDTIALPKGTNALSFPKNDRGFAVTRNSQIHFSTDGGRHFIANNNFDSSQISVGHLYSVLFLDSKIGLAVGAHKTIYRTLDGGEHWTLLSYLLQSDYKYTAVQFITEDTGFVGCSGFGLVFRTHDAGATWLPQRASEYDTILSGGYVSSLHFYDSRTGIACPGGSGGSVLRTTDGGSNYSQKFSITNGLASIHALSPDFTVVVGSDAVGYSTSKLSISTDRGLTWSTKVLDSIAFTKVFCASNSVMYCTGSYQSPQNQFNYTFFVSRDRGQSFEKKALPSFIKNINSIYFFDEFNGVATANDQMYRSLILRTEDGGSSWLVADSGRVTSASAQPAISFNDRHHGYVAGSGGRVLETNDGGKTWQPSPTPGKEIIQAIYSLSNDVAYAVGGFNSGLVMKKLPRSFYTSVSEATIDIAPTVWLYNPRPVPTSGIVHIDAIWSQSIDVSTIQVKLYSMLGIEIQNITTSLTKNAGGNTAALQFDGSALLSGIYYIEIQGGGGRMSLPIVIAR